MTGLPAALAAWCAFAGAWLLVAGPLFQASLELAEQQIEDDRMARTVASVPTPAPIAEWWWLLPPVRLWKMWRQARGRRRAIMLALAEDDVESVVTFVNKSTGWLYVASGGLLLATNETYEVTEHQLHADWPVAVLIVLVLAFACAGNAALRTSRSKKIVSQGFEGRR